MSYRHVEGVLEAVVELRRECDIVTAVDVDIFSIVCEIGHNDMVLLIACNHINYGRARVEGSGL